MADKSQTVVVGKELVKAKCGNTTNLFYHINQSHEEEEEEVDKEVEEIKQIELDLVACSKYGKSSKRH